jgi:hypothetical protein
MGITLYISLTLVAGLLWRAAFRPAKSQSSEQARQELERFRNFQAFAVLNFHPSVLNDPQLSKLSVRELRRHYNVTQAYEQLGL